jgi:hypothetical protein
MASRVRTKLTEVLKGLLERVVMLILLILGPVISVLGFVLGMAAIVAGTVAVFLLLRWCVGPGVATLGATITFVGICHMLQRLGR